MFWKPKKVFCIGRNKTGTTSLSKALKMLGYRVGKQGKAERLLDDWGRRDFRKIVQYCRWADAFQDVPFSLDYTYQVLDHAYPGSKFILSVRDSPDQWFDSLIRSQTRIVGKGRLPTAEDLMQFSYCDTGWLWRQHQMVYGVDESTLYNPDIYKQHYRNHNQKILEYFKCRPDDLLVINPSDSDAMQKLCTFLGHGVIDNAMPQENRSA
ncbi:MAG: hypothetical protein KKA22_10170 [Gammaproteobacteria bacterium]|nr:hypothetical protein [Gammaproteobacteria bacterium]MBU1408497.1 hypothetical protein [Gammaproteobacteria bacterium]MBU1532309.1 hypothetical protein [Gammaproteobacteria bacterium]